MSIVINGGKYEIIFGTDVSRPDARNGYFIEMRALESPEANPFLFAFRSNQNGTITISMYRQDVSITVLKYFLNVVEREYTAWPIWQEPSE